MTDFDPDVFMSSTTTEAGATHFDPIPEETYRAIVGTEQGKDVALKTPKPGMAILEVWFDIDDPALAERLNRQHLKSKHSIFLDVTADGKLDTGPNKNVKLGRLREAVGQNTPGAPWSPNMLLGAGPVEVLISHRMVEDDTYDEVKKVAAVA